MSKEELPNKDKISDLFKDPKFIAFVRKVLPELFNQLQIDFMDGNKVNPAVGIPRQKLLTAMFEVNEEGSIKEDSEMDGQKDVHLYDKPVSIKAVTCKGKGKTRRIPASSIKLSWGGNAESKTKRKQRKSFNPQYGMIIASFALDFDGTNHSGKWTVGLIYVPQHVVEAVFKKLKVKGFVKKGSEGDGRGDSISIKALTELHAHADTVKIGINWKMPASWKPKSDLDFWKHKIKKIRDEEE
tara:strand:- start:1200 stop:1922 length:723 start_codon:yes stop_codon:yes gene_type:complete